MDGPLECPAVEGRGHTITSSQHFAATMGYTSSGTASVTDALAGLLGGLTAQGRYGLPPWGAVWLHGRAGDLAAARLTEYCVTPEDVLASLRQLVSVMTARTPAIVSGDSTSTTLSPPGT